MPTVLTLNGGSSSIRFAFYDVLDPSRKLLYGKIERIGLSRSTFTMEYPAPSDCAPVHVELDAANHGTAAAWLMDRLAGHPLFGALRAVGHRVVHGMQHSAPERITRQLICELKRFTPFDPEHLPREIELIDSVARALPALPQVACFDTAFHRVMPRVATLLPIPRRYEAKGVQRYGFHGLSYTYLLGELGRQAGAADALGRVIFAHLGNGASLAAVNQGKCVDTSMGFTPMAGVMMSTRSGDLDPGVMSFLAATEGMDAVGYQRMITHESGLLGVSETSSDIRDLLESEARDVRAAEAIALFCYQVKKCIGSFAAALGGVDTLVFAGGIGENATAIRARICAGLEFLGIKLDESRNAQNAALVSADSGAVAVRVIKTDEESVIAGTTVQLLALNTLEDIHQ